MAKNTPSHHYNIFATTSLSAKLYYRLVLLAILLSLVVMALGSYARLTHGGFGCTDWSTCDNHEKLSSTNPITPTTLPITLSNQTTEATPSGDTDQTQRYATTILGFLVGVLALWGYWRRRRYFQQPILIPTLLILAALLQGLFATARINIQPLPPILIVGHLMTGFILAALLMWLAAAANPNQRPASFSFRSLRFWTVLGLLIVIGQLFLGAWTSAHGAALACPDFPLCHDSWIPSGSWATAFGGWSLNAANPLTDNSRMIIQMTHRYGALITLLYLGLYSCALIKGSFGERLQRRGILLVVLLMLQWLLGLSNVLAELPLFIGVLHTLVAALLLLMIVNITYHVFRLPSQSQKAT